jgi:hypothetical protein
MRHSRKRSPGEGDDPFWWTNRSEGELELPGWGIVCYGCGIGITFLPDFEIKRLVEKGYGWEAHGVGRRRLRLQCPSCGRICTEITARLPVELSDLPCPQCEKKANYAYKIRCVQVEEDEFEFVASITCRACSKTSRFTKLSRGLRRITGVKLGPLGIDIDLKDDVPGKA